MSYQLTYKIHTLNLRIKSFSRIFSRRYKKYLQSTLLIRQARTKVDIQERELPNVQSSQLPSYDKIV